MLELFGLVVLTFKYPLLCSIVAIWQLRKYHPKRAILYYILALCAMMFITAVVSHYRIEWLYQERKERLSGMVLWLYLVVGVWTLLHWYRAWYRKRILDQSLSSAYRYFHQPYPIIKAYVDAKPLAHQIMWQRYLRDRMRWQVAMWLMVVNYLWLRDFLYFRLVLLDYGMLMTK